MKKLLLLIIVGIIAIPGFGQILDPVLGPRVYKKDNVPTMKAVELTYLREADAMFSTRIWRVIDMRQKLNHPLYFPLDSTYQGKRSFVQVIYDEFVMNPNNVGPNAVKFYADDQLRVPLTVEDVKNMLEPSRDVQILDPVTCNPSTQKATYYFKTDVKPKILKLMIMEDWFFDKQRSVMDVRILAIGIECVKVEPKEEMNAACNNQLEFRSWEINKDATNIFWMFFPQLRAKLATIETYNRENDAMRLSYDDIFLQRIFSSYIYKQENVYNRTIAGYTAGLEALLESEKIKQEIFDYEQFLWEY